MIEHKEGSRQVGRIDSVHDSKLEGELSRIFSSLGHGMYVVDSDRKIYMWNKAAEYILGWSSQDALGLDCKEFISHTDDKGNNLCDTECPLRKSMNDSRTVFAGTVWAKTKEEEKKPVNVSCAPLLDEDGNLYGAVEVFSDATVEKMIDRMKTQMCSVVAHELRTPLTVIKLYLETLLDEEAPNMNDEQLRMIKTVRENTERLESLVDDLLDLEKIVSGRLVLHLDELDLKEITTQLVEEFKPLAIEKELSFKFNLYPVPIITGDRKLLYQAFSNLISNAIKYTNERQVEITVKADDKSIFFEVRDTGVGIPEEELEHLGERFFRASTADVSNKKGSGLGLAITKEILSKHKALLQIESRVGIGSTFTVIFPIEPKKEEDVETKGGGKSV